LRTLIALPSVRFRNTLFRDRTPPASDPVAMEFVK
jgi:hypothetical protein